MRWRTVCGDRWVRPFFGRYRKALAAALGLGVCAAALAAALMFTSGYLISAAACQPPGGVFALLTPLAFVQLFGIARPFAAYFERLRSHDWVLRMTSALRLRLFWAVDAEALSWTAARRCGDVLGLLDQDVAHVQNLYLRCVFPCVVGWALWLLASLAFGFFSPAFGLGMLLELGVACLLAPLVSLLVNGARRTRAKRRRAGLYARLTDDVLGVADWLCSGRADDCLEAGMRACAEADALDAIAARFERRRDCAVQLVLGCVAVCVLVWAAGRFGTTAELGDMARPANWVAAFVLGLFPLAETFAPLSAAVEQAEPHLDAVARLNELGEPAAPGADEPIAAVPAGFELRLAGVRFAYPGEAGEVLRGVDLVLCPGEHVAVLGPSGTGKSTLVGLLRGDLAPTAGAVELGGVPTTALGEQAARWVSVVQQDPYLFGTTLFENLRVGKPDASRDEAAAALRAVGLAGLLERLPRGLDTPVDEAGLRFSGGERHRIALARVLLRDAPVVVLDEPTVGLDPATEAALLETVLRVFAGKTLVMVTHHLLGVAAMDRVVFLENGRIALEGGPAELEATSPRYRRLLEIDRNW